MKKKKFLALLAAGVMSLSMSLTAFAKTPQEIVIEYSYEDVRSGNMDISQEEHDDLTNWLIDLGIVWEDPEYGWLISRLGFEDLVASLLGGGSSGSSGSDYDRVAEAQALAIKAMGYNNKIYAEAVAEGKTYGEYMNNAVVETWGIEDSVPVAQGGNVIINGEKTNVDFSVMTVTSGETAYAQSLARSVGGKLLNVVRIYTPVYFDTAEVTFYTPGITAGQNIQVYEYDRDSAQWVKIDVTEVREDHVVVNMTSRGILAFVDVTAK